MWTLDPRELLVFQGAGGGEPFARLINALLHAQAFTSGIPDAQVSTNIKVNLPDGGVDAAVHGAVPTDKTGYFTVPSVWQYKAVASLSDKELREEIGKPYSRELIERGYGYRFCICNDLDDGKKRDWEKLLTAEARSFASAAPDALVLTASGIANWANRFPSLIGNIFGRPLALGLHWKAWEARELSLTRVYVLPNDWDPYMSAVRQHISFSLTTQDPILLVKGAAGVGKSRLAFEAIRESGAEYLAILTDDEERADEMARWLVNQTHTKAILVADECSVEGRYKLRRTLRGTQDRIRAVVIDNEDEGNLEGAPAVALPQMSVPSVEQVLGKNFPHVPQSVRRACASLSEGYVRLAADLCNNADKLREIGTLGSALAIIDEYYRSRPGVTEEDRRVIEAVSLVNRVGCYEDIAQELEDLAALTGISANAAIQTASRLKAAPGYLARTPRYLYVTPKIIAEIAFRRAWKNLAEPNPSKFLNSIPPSLLGAFQKQVRELLIPEVRSIVSAHFRDQITSFQPDDLVDETKIDRLLGMLETDPVNYLPQLERLIRSATHEQLLRMGEAGTGHRSTRRGIVWAVERLASFPEFFAAAEFILRRLALAESEPGIGNNATGIWQQLFRMYLSGSSVAFSERIDILRGALFSHDDSLRTLAAGALDYLLDTHTTRIAGPAVVGGRIPPGDWQPTTRDEWEECFRLTLDLISDSIRVGTPHADIAWGYLVRHLRSLLAHGHLDRLREFRREFSMPSKLAAAWLEEIDNAIQYECAGGVLENIDNPELCSYCKGVIEWRAECTPPDFAGRLRAVVGKDYWHHSIREDIHKGESEIEPIADAIIADHSLLENEMEFLCSVEARSAAALGTALGRKDPQAALLQTVLAGARRLKGAALVSGYTTGLLRQTPEQSGLINSILDGLETEDPEIALQITLAALNETRSSNRLLRLASSGKLDATILQYVLWGDVLPNMPSEQVGEALRVLLGAESLFAMKIASEIVAIRLRGARSDKSIREDADTKALMMATLERAARVDDRGDYWWGDALEMLKNEFPSEAAQIAVSGIEGEDFGKRDRSASVLAALGLTHSDMVLNEIGSSLLNPKTTWKWRLGGFRAVFASLSVEALARWLDRTGTEGALSIARQLPTPSISDGKPLVPPITEMFLSRFGDNEDVFTEFCAGTHQLEVTMGPLSTVYERYAHDAEPFLNHPSPYIRKWAEREFQSAQHFSEMFRRREEDAQSGT